MKRIIVLFTCLFTLFTTTIYSQSTIDVMVVYTQEAGSNLLNYGDAKAALTEIQEAINYTNQAFTNSNVQITLNLVHTAEIDFTPSGNDGESLQWLTKPNDGVIDEVHRWRDSVHADIVVLLSHAGSVSGIGGWAQGNSTEWETEAFCIVMVGNDMSVTDDRTFAHEIGHLLGAQHDWYNGPILGLFNGDEMVPSVMHNHGYVYIDHSDSTGFYTIMAYSNMCLDMSANCDAIPYFSNPDVSYGGIPTGIEEVNPIWNINSACYSGTTDVDTGGCPADNASVFNWMAPVIASYRSANGPDGKVTDLLATYSAPHSVNLSWKDNSSNETGFRISRSIDAGMNFNPCATVGANDTVYTDTIDNVVTIGKEWIYRVQAYNDSGITTYAEDTLTININCGTIDDDFESGDFTALPWVNNSVYPWIISDREDITGLAVEGDTTLSWMGWGAGEGPGLLELTVPLENGFICFDINAKTLVQFALDSTYLANAAWSLTAEWDTVAIPVNEGMHLLQWEFFGGNKAWIDNVYLPIKTYTLSYAAGSNGSLNGTTSQTVEYGKDGTEVEAIPDTGYHFVDWSDGSTDNPRTDTNIVNDTTVTANFSIDTYTLTYHAGANGSISDSTPQIVNYGDDGAEVEAIPDTGYHFVDWSDGCTDNPRTDTNVVNDTTVTANFAINTYTLTYHAGANGSISDSTPQIVNYGDDGAEVEAVPDNGYYFIDWSDGREDNPRTDTNVTSDVTVTANFGLNSEILVENSETIKVSIYPNPVKGELHIKLNGEFAENSKLSYQLYDINMKMIEQKGIENTETTISFENLAPSVYFIKIIDGNNNVKTFKFQKQ